jgi:alanine racemase
MLYTTHLEVDLGALRHNVQVLKRRAGDRKVLVAVKADGYGHGAVPIARLFEREKLADWLGVATVAEAIALRQAGVSLPILKLSQAFPDELPAAIDADVALTVVDEETADEAAAAAKIVGRPVNVHLALDTGMRRIGADPAHAVALARYFDEDQLNMQGIFTHLPISDVPAGRNFTVAELARFRAAVTNVPTDRAARGLPKVPLIHAAASAGVLAHDLGGVTMVRPGIVIYGSYPDAQTARTVELRPALTMRSRVSFIKRISAGETVSYGRTWTAPTDRWIATVPVGYADGFNRLNSNRGRMLINGRSFPVAGRVCMDQTMLDLGEADDHGVKRGDDVIIIGRSGDEYISTDELAELAGTISYEVTAVIPPRVSRQYFDSDEGTVRPQEPSSGRTKS